MLTGVTMRISYEISVRLPDLPSLQALGMSLEQAQAAGWAMPASEGEQKFWDLWGLFNIQGLSLEGICLGAAARQVGKVSGGDVYVRVCVNGRVGVWVRGWVRRRTGWRCCLP